MNAFQQLALGFLAAVVAWELVGLSRGTSGGPGKWFRLFVWTLTAVAVANPKLVTSTAHVLGIERGADLVLYLFVFAFLATSFFLYAQTVKLRREITDLVRYIAIREAVPPGGEPAPRR